MQRHAAGRALCVMAILLSFCNGDEQDWTWTGSSTWGQKYPQCNGKEQSPIDLDSHKAKIQYSAPLHDGAISIAFKDYDKCAGGDFTNVGFSVQLTLNFNDKSTAPRLTIKAYGVTTIYYFQSLHFHWKSPHYINGERFPLEMHMVHQSDAGQRLGLAYLFKVCSESRDSMDTIATNVREVSDYPESVNINKFCPSSVMPHTLSICNYFQYSGSLTKPPCTEGIPWVVYKEPQCIKESQLAAFDGITDESGKIITTNARPLQPINNRTIIYHECILRW